MVIIVVIQHWKIVCLEQLHELKMLILMSTFILDMELDLIEKWIFIWLWIWSNCKIFGVDMSSSVHVGNKKKDILVLCECPPQGLDGTTLTAEK